MKFTDSLHCTSQVHCKTCRSNSKFREGFLDKYEWDETCPYGFTEDNYPSVGLGDTVAKITNKIGIKPCGGCKKRQEFLNKAFPYKK